jgi:hypothetical protein
MFGGQASSAALPIEWKSTVLGLDLFAVDAGGAGIAESGEPLLVFGPFRLQVIAGGMRRDLPLRRKRPRELVYTRVELPRPTTADAMPVRMEATIERSPGWQGH